MITAHICQRSITCMFSSKFNTVLLQGGSSAENQTGEALEAWMCSEWSVNPDRNTGNPNSSHLTSVILVIWFWIWSLNEHATDIFPKLTQLSSLFSSTSQNQTKYWFLAQTPHVWMVSHCTRKCFSPFEEHTTILPFISKLDVMKENKVPVMGWLLLSTVLVVA